MYFLLKMGIFQASYISLPEGIIYNHSLRIQIFPKGIPLQSYSGDGIEAINPTRLGGVWILMDLEIFRVRL